MQVDFKIRDVDGGNGRTVEIRMSPSLQQFARMEQSDFTPAAKLALAVVEFLQTGNMNFEKREDGLVIPATRVTQTKKPR